MQKITTVFLAIAALVLFGCDSKPKSEQSGSAAEYDGKTLPKLLSQADIDAVIKNNKEIGANFQKFGKENPETANLNFNQNPNAKQPKINEIDVKQIIKAVRTGPSTAKYNELLRQSGMKSSEPLLAYLVLLQNYAFLQIPKFEKFLGMMPKDQQANMQAVIKMQKDINAITHKDDFELVKKNESIFLKAFQ